MNLKKFQDEKPRPDATAHVLDRITENDAKYIDSLKNLKYKSSNKSNILQIVYTTAAVFVAVVAFTIWAIIGRGIRGTDIIHSTSSGGREYAVTVNPDRSIKDGANRLQGFFDDYMAAKPCTLNIMSDEKNPETTLVCNADGSGTLKSAQDEQTVFEALKFAIDYNFIQVLTAFESRKIDIDLSGLDNTYPNSTKVFDSSKAEPVSVQDGYVVSGEVAIQDFFESYIGGLCAGARVSDNIIFFDGSDLYHTTPDSDTARICVGIDLSADSTDNNMIQVTAYESFGPNGNGFTPPFVSIRTDEIARLKLLLNSRNMTISQYGDKNIQTDKKFTADLLSELRASSLDVYKTALPYTEDYTLYINDYIHIYVYRDKDGSISDLFGFDYTGISAIQSVRVSEKFRATLEQLISEYYEQDAVLTAEQKL